MRKLLWFTVGFSASFAIVVYLFAGRSFMLAAFISLLLFIIACFMRYSWSKIGALVLAGCTIGFIWFYCYNLFVVSPAREFDMQTISAKITVIDYSKDIKYGYSTSGELSTGSHTYKVLFYHQTDEPMNPGDVIEGNFELRYTGLDGMKPSTYHIGNGVLLLAYPESDLNIIRADSVDIKYFPLQLRRGIQAILDTIFESDMSAFARALLLGDTDNLSYETDLSFKESGIRHIVAVSGLHVSILFALIYLAVGKNRFLTAIVGIPVLILFAAVAGFTPSIVRACVMQGLIILAMLFYKDYDPPTAVAFAVLIMLALNPMAIASVSLQLSVGCVAGIFAFSGKINRYLLSKKLFHIDNKFSVRAKVIRWFVGSVSVSVGAMLFTTPLSAAYFGMISIVGILANLLTLWVVSFIFYGIMFACIIGAIWMPLGKVIAWTVSWLIKYVLFAAKMLSSIPFSTVYTCSIYIVIWLILCYVLFALFVYFKRKHKTVLIGCVLFSLIFSLFMSWLEPRLDDYRLTVFDVGQGQCILLQCGESTYLVDCGGDRAEAAAEVAASTLLSQGVFRVDGLILTHFDDDHAEGTQYFISQIHTDMLYLPVGNEDKHKLDFSENDKCIITEPVTVSDNSVTITLVPNRTAPTDNESGLAILFQTEKCDILITGDMDTAGEKRLMETVDLPEVDVLIVGHHGSAYSTGYELLFKTRPKTAIISVSANNPYGHPADTTIKRLISFGCDIRRTDLEGTIIIRE